jgi:RecB family exonuclease
MQRRELVRTRDLTSFRRALVERALEGPPWAARRRAVLVPTRAAAALLRQSIETAAADRGAQTVIVPACLTREEWLSTLHAALPGVAPLVTRVEREVLLARAARAAGRRGWLPAPPFELRPGLVGAMLDFYDELGRRNRSVRRFTRAVLDELRVERGTDRGSEGLVRQTVFLGFAFLGYERGLSAHGVLDEHGLRAALLRSEAAGPFDHVVVAVADHPADPRGLWPADFDLLGRLRGVTRLDVVVTDEIHDAGFRDRLERELPGIDEAPAVATAPQGPVLVLPVPADGSERPPDSDLCFVSRDREDELRDVVRLIAARLDEAPDRPGAPVAIVFHRPLPYLYLAEHVLSEADVPFQALDALPLAAEPFAALLDMALAMARTGGTREAAIGLLRSRLLHVAVDDVRVGLRDVAALDRVLAERRAIGEADTYVSEVEGFFEGRESRGRLERDRAHRAARAAALLRDVLRPFRTAASASGQLDAVASFLRRFEAVVDGSTEAADRYLRARAAVLGVIDGLSSAFRQFDDRATDPAALVTYVRHAVEARTFAPRRGRTGVHLVDAMSARFGRFDHVHVVGLVETDWPAHLRRSVFYASGMLRTLGWPQEADQMRAGQAAFRDLLRLAHRTVHLHAFHLDGDAIVGRSPLVDMARDLPTSAEPRAARANVFEDERLVSAGESAAVQTAPGGWLDLRRRRPPITDRRFTGYVSRQPEAAYRVSRVDRYVDCPFKYFAESVLNLAEERDEMAGLTPLERGSLVHELFERFYREWQASGHGTITPATLPEALDRFGAIVRRALARLPEPDRVLEETRLLGSIVARGLAARVFELESDAGGRIVDRLIEHPLQGPFVFPLRNGLEQRTIQIRGKADRVDVFDDGSLRVIDYKLGRLPDVDASVQIGVYAHCAQATLEAQDSRPHPVRAAMYLAFGDDRQLEGALAKKPAETAFAVAARASAFAGAVAEIEAGQFPPRPRRPPDCQYCGYAGVCRKEYSLDVDEPDEEDRETDAPA